MSLSLFSGGITAPVNALFGPVQPSFGRPPSATFLWSWSNTGGGTNVTVLIQTSFDGGNSWFDMGKLVLTSTVTGYANLDFLSPVAITSLSGAAIADNAIRHGLMGDQVRVSVTSTGTFSSGSRLDVWMQTHG